MHVFQAMAEKDKKQQKRIDKTYKTVLKTNEGSAARFVFPPQGSVYNETFAPDMTWFHGIDRKGS